MTILEVLNATTGYFEKHGVESPRLNAEHLLAHSLQRKRLDLYLEFDRPLSEADRSPLRDLVRRRANGVPLQHLLGTSVFLGHEFLCDARALIPRPETEQLVELALSLLKTEPAASLRLADVGTGSGVIAISLALAFPAGSVHATDVSPDALALATENATRLNATNVAFSQANLLPPGDDRFDLIAANLPYIPAAEIPGLSREVQHDPVSALDGGPDGLDLIRQLATTAHPRLNPGAHLILEIGHDQAPSVVELLTEAGYSDITAHRDYAQIDRFITARAS